MNDPLTAIEDRHAAVNVGTNMYLAYVGATLAGASRIEAMLIAAAWLIAAIHQPKVDE